MVCGALRVRDNVMAEGRPFLKMHGLGNDFVVVDARREPFRPSRTEARAIADRRHGVGCDQLIILEPPQSPDADIFMRIRNADGGEVEACGNATRCVASLVMKEKGRPITIETVAGLLRSDAAENGDIRVDMGLVRTAWDEIPLAEKMDTLHLDLALGPLADPVAVNIGNPHAVFFVDDCEAIDLEALGPKLEVHPLFPQRANISVATARDRKNLRMRVWERGVGITVACGSGACAVAVAGARRNLTERRAVVEMDGGAVGIEWRPDGHVTMTGPVATAFRGELLL
jgi:diaminopimelate epimerase